VSLTAFAAAVVSEERRRRADLREAVRECVRTGPEIDEFVSTAAIWPGRLRSSEGSSRETDTSQSSFAGRRARR